MAIQRTEPHLRDLIAASGAVYGPGVTQALRFGDAESELQSLLDGAGMAMRSAATISHTGPDALDLLHRLTTNDLLSLEPGRALGTVITSDNGRIVDVITVAMKDRESLLLLSEAPDARPAMEFIDRYTIIEDATLTDLTSDVVRLSLAGPGSQAIIEKLTGLRIENGSAIATQVGGVDVDVVRLDWPGLPHMDLVAPAESAMSLWQALADAGAAPVGDEAFHTARVICGVPFPGGELTARANPLEAGLESLVSFTKGCYIGQEVIARLDSYDKLQRRLMGLVSDGSTAAGNQLTTPDGKRAGEVTSVAPLKVGGKTLALGLVRKGSWEPGQALLCGDTGVTVAALPFAR